MMKLYFWIFRLPARVRKDITCPEFFMSPAREMVLQVAEKNFGFAPPFTMAIKSNDLQNLGEI